MMQLQSVEEYAPPPLEAELAVSRQLLSVPPFAPPPDEA
jgi:hypothetical protein